MSIAPDSVTAGADHLVPVTRVTLREFTMPAPPQPEHYAAVRPYVRTDPVRGWLVGISDGEHWGWWGPVEGAVALPVPGLLAAAFPEMPAQVDPVGFARRLRRASRHAHTGLLGISVGAAELALWDLTAKRIGLPVWRLLSPSAVTDQVPVYATCFGVRDTGPRTTAVMNSVAETYRVQKWDPLILEPDLVHAAAGFLASHGPGRLAVDFHGMWHPDRVRAACAPVADDLAWVEEPYHPDEVEQAQAGEFGTAHAAGEHCYCVADAAQLRAGHVDVWQPDAVFCGGLMNLRALVRAAADAGARCAPHGGGLVPALHLAAIGECIDAIELHLLLEPRRCVHLDQSPVSVGADSLPIPTAPGWGGELRGELRMDLVDG